MSINQILLQEPDYPAPWTNLSVNSIKVKTSIINPPITPLTQSNVYVSGAGNDSNDGLTAGTPVLTMKRAIEVASNDSASECVINISGTVGIGSSAAPSDSGFDKVLDFGPLSSNYQFITILGERSDEFSFAAGVATSSTTTPYAQWYDLNGLAGLTPSAYTQGFVNKNDGTTQDLYVCVRANGATSASVCSNDGPDIATDGFSIYNVGTSIFFDDSKYFISSSIPITVKDLQWNGPTTSDRFVESNHTIRLYACVLNSQAAGGFLKGNFDCNGVVFTATTAGWPLFIDYTTVEIQSGNFINLSQEFSSFRSWDDVHGSGTYMIFNSSVGEINRMLCVNNGATRNVSCMICINSNLSLSSCALQLDAGTQSVCDVENSNLKCDSGFSAQRTTSGIGEGLNCRFGSSVYILGDCTIDGIDSPGVSLNQSQLSIKPDDGATPSNIFTSTSEFAISVENNSLLGLYNQNTKNVYNIISSSKEAVHVSSGSQLNIVPVFANGPNFSSPGTFAMIKNSYASKTTLGDANYEKLTS